MVNPLRPTVSASPKRVSRPHRNGSLGRMRIGSCFPESDAKTLGASTARSGRTAQAVDLPRIGSSCRAAFTTSTDWECVRWLTSIWTIFSTSISMSIRTSTRIRISDVDVDTDNDNDNDQDNANDQDNDNDTDQDADADADADADDDGDADADADADNDNAPIRTMTLIRTDQENDNDADMTRIKTSTWMSPGSRRRPGSPTNRHGFRLLILLPLTALTELSARGAASGRRLVPRAPLWPRSRVSAAIARERDCVQQSPARST